MILRRNFLPRTVSDALVTIFTLVIIPVVYYFELFVVFPRYHSLWSGWYNFHFIGGTFVLFNLCSNYMAIVLCDTSIRGRLLPTTLGPNCRFCVVCECITPPRSWHCNVCNVCILKRDHHCMFTSCCVGHHNVRYFFVFVLYMFVATVYCSCYNVFFVFEFTDFGTFESIVKLIFPLAYLFVDYSLNQMYLFLVLIVMIGGMFTGVLLYFHGNLIIRGMVTHERNQRLSPYDYGTVNNIVQALGEKWYLVWLSPFLQSKLPHDGINWDAKQSLKAK